MGRLIYRMNVSLDGFVSDPDGSVDWGLIDDELHAWFNDELRDEAAFIYGRRVYELMAASWPNATSDPTTTPVMLQFARIWNAKPKVVFSRTLRDVRWNSRLAVGDVREELERIRREHDGDLEVAGPTLAAAFIRKDLVDEFRMVVHPVLLGGGTPFFPPLDRPMRLRPNGVREFPSGVVVRSYLRS